MTEPASTVTSICHEVRSKNAGPFWTTLDLFLKDAAGYAIVAGGSFLNEGTVAALYGVEPGDVRIFRLPALNVVKISFPRRVPQGGLHDRDMHSGQQHVPLALLPLP